MSSAFDSFAVVHQYQLDSIPKELWQSLFMKLGEDYLDAGAYVEIHHGDPLNGYSLHVKADKELKKHGDIFLIDHAWTTSPENARQELLLNPALMDRLENLMNIEQEPAPQDSDDEEEEEEEPASEELVQLVASQANVSLKQAKEALKIENNEVVNAIMRLTLDPEVKMEQDQLQDQVIGQMLASGQPQEKEKREQKESRERREKREQEWFKIRAHTIYQKMWSFIQTYSYSILQESGQPAVQTAWYINDEVGSSISHSADPNFVCLPFIFSRGASGMIPYSVIFPIKDIKAGEIITADFVPKNLKRESDRAAYLFSFEDRVFLSDAIEEEREKLVASFKSEHEKLSKVTFTPSSSKVVSAEQAATALKENKKDKSEAIVVYTDTSFIQQYLKLDNVKFTENINQADIIWTTSEFKDWDSLKPGQIVNQFPNECCITYKQNMAQLIQKSFGLPDWYPVTYNVVTQLSELVGHYLKNQEEDAHNLWLTKPWNSARGIGLDITSNLSELIRQHDNSIPKIAQLYETSPCLYNGKKFDLRYIVLVRRINPTLISCVYNMFWVRLANKKFGLDNLDDYERHFTVMNYSNYQMTQLDHKSFIHNMEKQHDIKWDPIQKEINQSIKDVLAAAVTEQQPIGLSAEETTFDSFGVYGFDIMLTDTFKPLVIEANFAPDCTRACQYDPEFVNNIFSLVDGRFGTTDKGLQAFTTL
ncbi:TTL-domain-containing protein, partial [Backusella circina FSU 941]